MKGVKVMPNWVVHHVLVPNPGDDAADARVLDVCRQHPEECDDGPDGFVRCPDGAICVRYITAYAQSWEIAYEVSLVVPGTVVKLEFAEPMLVTFGTVEFLNGHVLRFWERNDRDVWEWSAETGIYREIALTYLDPEDPYGPTTECVALESIRGESEMFTHTGLSDDVDHTDGGDE